MGAEWFILRRKMGAVDQLAAAACDQGAERLLRDGAGQELNGAVGPEDVEALLEMAADFRQWLVRVEGQVVRLGPRHRRGCFDHQQRVRGAVLEIVQRMLCPSRRRPRNQRTPGKTL